MSTIFAPTLFACPASFLARLPSHIDCSTYAPDQSRLFWSREKLAQLEPQARIKMMQVLGSTVYTYAYNAVLLWLLQLQVAVHYSIVWELLLEYLQHTLSATPTCTTDKSQWYCFIWGLRLRREPVRGTWMCSLYLCLQKIYQIHTTQ